MGVVFGHIEVSPVVDGYRWLRDLRTGEQAQVSVEDINILAERWFKELL